VIVRWPTDLGLVTAEGVLVATETDLVPNWVVEVRRTAREQRRAAYRLPVQLEAAVRPAGGLSVPTDATTEDVSELGIACTVVLSEAPAIGTTVEVTIAVPGVGPMVAGAAVVRVEEVPPEEDEPRRFRLGLELVDDDPHRREQLRRYVLDEQLRRLGRRG
jgi:c-di-GMP-binding flagellar brake protein YcgR